MKAKPKSELPTSGRIGRFAQFLIAIGGENAALKITRGIESYDKLKAPEKAAWWDITMVRMEKTLGREKALEVMQSCGRKCCGAQTRSRAKALYRESSSIADFLTRLNKTGMGGGRLVLVDDHTIMGGYDRCYCGQVAAATKPFASDIYCQCSRTWLEEYFSSIFNSPAKVRMDETIREGAQTCEFTVRLM